MEIILKEDVSNLGNVNDIVTVKDGYARNYLIPRGKAIMASKSAKRHRDEIIKQKSYKDERLKNEAEKKAEEIKRKKLKIGAKTSSSGKIFGSVNDVQIAEALQKKGVDIDRKMITINEEPIKEVGDFTAIIKLHRDVVVELPFTVVSE